MKQEIIVKLRGIVNGIPRGVTFDAHYVIKEFFKSEADLYLECSGKSIATWHSNLAKEIRKFEEDGIIRKLPEKHYSETLVGSFRPNTAWKKLTGDTFSDNLPEV